MKMSRALMVLGVGGTPVRAVVDIQPALQLHRDSNYFTPPAIYFHGNEEDPATFEMELIKSLSLEYF